MGGRGKVTRSAYWMVGVTTPLPPKNAPLPDRCDSPTFGVGSPYDPRPLFPSPEGTMRTPTTSGDAS